MIKEAEVMNHKANGHRFKEWEEVKGIREEFLWTLNELIHLKHLEQCLTCTQPSIHVSYHHLYFLRFEFSHVMGTLTYLLLHWFLHRLFNFCLRAQIAWKFSHKLLSVSWLHGCFSPNLQWSNSETRLMLGV